MWEDAQPYPCPLSQREGDIESLKGTYVPEASGEGTGVGLSEKRKKKTQITGGPRRKVESQAVFD